MRACLACFSSSRSSPPSSIGCAGSDETAPAPNYVFNVDLTSNFTDIRTFNDGTRQAGWLRFDGDTTVNGQAITLSVQSAVNYTRGSGPLSGLLTLTFPDTSTVTIRMAVTPPSTT